MLQNASTTGSARTHNELTGRERGGSAIGRGRMAPCACPPVQAPFLALVRRPRAISRGRRERQRGRLQPHALRAREVRRDKLREELTLAKITTPNRSTKST
jgi:hypothetical protein